MKSIHIRNLEEETLSGLKARAKRHHRSLQKEVEVLLRDAARMTISSPSFGSALDRLHTVTGNGQNKSWNREEMYGDQGR